MAIIVIGIIVKNTYKIQRYRRVKEMAHTDMSRREIMSHYRPLIFTGLAIQIIGFIVCIIALKNC